MSTFDWQSFLELAEALRQCAEDSQDPSLAEASLRSSISRAYYAAFHAAKSYIEKTEVMSPFRGKTNDHGAAIDYLQSHSDHQLRKMGEQLGRLRRRRNNADYDVHPRITDKHAEGAIRNARDIVDALGSAV